MKKNKILSFFSTESEKNKIIIKNVSFAVIIKGIALFISIFSMPAYIRFFNNQIVLGLWFTILSILNWILAFDLGIGNGLRNKLAEAITNKNDTEARKYISSAYVAIGAISLLFMLAFFIIAKFVNWNSILGIDEKIISHKFLTISMTIVFIGIILQFFLKIITSILYAIQKSFITNLISFVISLSTLIFVLILPSKTNETNLVIMSIVHLLCTILPYSVCTIIVFSNGSTKKIYPNIKHIDKEHIKNVLSLGGNFFYIQIMYMIIVATNEFLINKLDNSASVVDYSIYYRLFSILSMIFTFLLAPIWSLITKAITEKDYIWVNSLYKKLLKLAAFLALSEFIIIPFLQIIVNVWLRKNAIRINYFYSLIFAIMGSLMIFISVFSSVANGMGKLKIQTICYTIGAILKVLLSVILVKISKSWIGVIVSIDIVMMIYCLIQPIYINKYLKEFEKKQREEVINEHI